MKTKLLMTALVALTIILSAEAGNSRLCSFMEWWSLSSNMGILDAEQALITLVKDDPENVEAARKLICILDPLYLRDALEIAIRNNAQRIISMMVSRGLQLTSVYSGWLDEGGETCGTEARHNPLHTLVRYSKGHADPVGMAILLTSLGARAQQCNALYCLTSLGNYLTYIFPDERPELDKNSELYHLLVAVKNGNNAMSHKK